MDGNPGIQECSPWIFSREYLRTDVIYPAVRGGRIIRLLFILLSVTLQRRYNDFQYSPFISFNIGKDWEITTAAILEGKCLLSDYDYSKLHCRAQLWQNCCQGIFPTTRARFGFLKDSSVCDSTSKLSDKVMGNANGPLGYAPSSSIPAAAEPGRASKHQTQYSHGTDPSNCKKKIPQVRAQKYQAGGGHSNPQWWCWI